MTRLIKFLAVAGIVALSGCGTHAQYVLKNPPPNVLYRVTIKSYKDCHWLRSHITFQCRSVTFEPRTIDQKDLKGK